MTTRLFMDVRQPGGGFGYTVDGIAAMLGVSIPAEAPAEDLLAWGFEEYAPTSRPAAGVGRRVAERRPAAVAGKLTQQWGSSARPLAERCAEVQAAADARREAETDAGFTFAGVHFQTRPKDRENIMGAGSSALAALMFGGAQPGDLKWGDPEGEDFAWIATDNAKVLMDAPTALAFYRSAAALKSRLVHFAHTLKRRAEAARDAGDAPAMDAVEADLVGAWPT